MAFALGLASGLLRLKSIKMDINQASLCAVLVRYFQENDISERQF